MTRTILFFCFISIGLLKAQEPDFLKKKSSLEEKMWSHFYSQQDSAYFYLNQIRQLAKKNNDVNTEIDAIFNTCGVASFFFDLSTSDSSLKTIESLIDTIKDKRSEEYLTHRNTLLYYRGDFLLKQYEYNRSRDCFKTIQKSFENLPDSLKNQRQHDLYAASFSFLGKIYLEEGKYDLAKQLYNKSIRNLTENNPDEVEAIYDNYNLLAEVYQKERYYSKANSYLLKTLPYNITNDHTNNVLSQALKIAENYNTLLQRDSALYYIEIAKPYLDKNTFFIPRYHKVRSEIYTTGQDYESAIAELTKALELAKARFEGTRYLDIPVIYDKIATILLDTEKPEKALENFNLGLQEALKISNNKNIILKLLKHKTQALNKLGSHENRNQVVENIDLGVAILDSLKPSFKSHSDKLVLIEDAFPLFESGLEATYQLYNKEKDDSFINKAFHYTEKSKAVILLDALLGARATEFANIPEGLLEQESQLKSRITHLKKLLDGSGEASVKEADELFELQQEHIKLVETFEKEYSAYYDLRYNNQVTSINDVQSALEKDELLISYFYGESAIYSISISNESKQMSRISLDTSLEKSITQFHEMLSNSKSDIDSLKHIANGLYQKLLASHLTNTSKEKLIIIPDGLLNYIPIGGLVTNIQQNRFLVEDKSISYANSATLWSQLNTKKQSQNQLLAFAPSFDSGISSDETRGNILGSLPHNKKEVKRILNTFNGKSLINKEATLQNFTSTISDYSILHLATHAVFDDKNPEYSYLAFTPDKDSENLLFVKDLYNLNLNAGLVTLSACESGIGELKRGEGFLSLARGFFYSGASSISSTLWKVNDNSSSELMGSFYEHLANGKSKDKSLQEAKLSFLEKNQENGLSHPYYWSGYIIQGNTQPLTESTTWHWYLLGGIMLILIFLGGKPLLQLFK